MLSLEQLEQQMQVRGIVPDQTVMILVVLPQGADTVNVVYRRDDGQIGQRLLFREQESELEMIHAERRWVFDGEGNLLKLVSEAYRIRLAHLFDPLLAVHTALINPLPHQITAVYEAMLPRQPLRFLLADDPGAGKTIMAGLLIRELMVRGDVHRCLICAPGSLTEQWQDELWQKFNLRFKILSREMMETARTGNAFEEENFLIVRLDQMSRNQLLWQRLQSAPEWDLIVCDEAHKMSASFFGGEVKETQRYKLGKLLGGLTRHLLLMTATPHNGKEEDFQLFMQLLDEDRFANRFKGTVPKAEASDLMRRMVKENLLKFDGKPLFPERRAYTIHYQLSPDEQELYQAVTDYVKEQFNRADNLEKDGRKGTVGFALTILQRRLASSPEAIYQSLRRRRERLENRLTEAQPLVTTTDTYNEEEWEETLEDVPDQEREEMEALLIDNATTATTIAELKVEIETLRWLEAKAGHVRRSGNDRKWLELQRLWLEADELRDPQGVRRKLVIFTEHRDTLNYLAGRLTTLLGREEALVMIHGGLQRDARREAEAQFRNNPDVQILLATDAAGEGINLQRAHLMVNYDLPWNPNRLEQRFGRIHRIGQTEVCHLWNLIAAETREGNVYARLLEKIKRERDALNGQVFDVLGKLFAETPLRKLLVDAIRYGEDPAVRARLELAVDNAVDQERVRALLEQQSLVENTLDTSQILRIREAMERASARRLQPYYVRSFFLQAFEQLAGTWHEQGEGRYSISYVPSVIREYARTRGLLPIARKYNPICFEKQLIALPGKANAEFICPGHSLLDATLGVLLERNRTVLQQGTILVDETDPSTEARVLFYMEQAIYDATPTRQSDQRIISQEVHFVTVSATGEVRAGGGAPYLDYRTATSEERTQLESLLQAPWLAGRDTEERALAYGASELARPHLERVRSSRLGQIAKTQQAVEQRLRRAINYWDSRAAELKAAEKAGRANAKLNSQQAERRAEEYNQRLQQRRSELAREKEISAGPPVIMGGVLVIPLGLLLGANTPPEMRDRRITEAIAMQSVMNHEIALGHQPRDVSMHNLGYDIESRDGTTGQLRFIEVKGRRVGAESVTVTYNEILVALNNSVQSILAVVLVNEDGVPQAPRYIYQPFDKDPGPAWDSGNINLKYLLARSVSD